jgi:hypothetical protein
MTSRRAMATERAMAEHVAAARARKRVRCQSRTTYDHSNLLAYVQSSLPAGWQVFGPGPGNVGDEVPPAPAQYPPAADEPTQAVLASYLAKQGVLPGVISGLDLEDELNGHCETAAAALSEYVLKTLSTPAAEPSPAGQCELSGASTGSCVPSAGQVVGAATTKIMADLEAGSTAEQVQILFRAKARALSNSHLLLKQGRGRVATMWGHLMPFPEIDSVLPGSGEDALVELMAGATAGLQERLARIVSLDLSMRRRQQQERTHSAKAEKGGVDDWFVAGRFAVPLYHRCRCHASHCVVLRSVFR